MSKTKHAEQITAALKQVGAGGTADDAARELWRVQANGLRLEGEVRRPGSERGAASAAGWRISTRA
jgi:hypothetical protein